MRKRYQPSLNTAIKRLIRGRLLLPVLLGSFAILALTAIYGGRLIEAQQLSFSRSVGYAAEEFLLHAGHELAAIVIRQVFELGAAAAGIAVMGDLRLAPSYITLDKSPSWPSAMQSTLIFGVAHPRTEPALDWWDAHPGGTPGNRVLMDMQKQLKGWLSEVNQVETE